jgi:F-type H+-transporting ATPase subunit c
VKKTFLTMGLILAAGFMTPAFAQEAAGAAASSSVVAQWSIITAGFALAIAAALGALGQGKAVSAAVEGIARNPSAAGDIRGRGACGRAGVFQRGHRFLAHVVHGDAESRLDQALGNRFADNAEPDHPYVECHCRSFTR